jgi:iron(III) transport system ATP-binding protein
MRNRIEDAIKAKSSSLRLVDVTKKFRQIGGSGEVIAVDNVNLSIESGELVTLLGPSGCGKTTTLRMVAGFESVTSGKLFLGDEMIESVPPNKRDMAMMFQSYALFPHMTVYNNIRYGLKLKKLPEAEITQRTNQIIELMQIKGMENRLPSQISGGQQQRVALARAVVIEPKVLLFDEPLSNLDAKLREYMRDELRALQKRLGITSLYVTHDQSEAMAISDKVVLMNAGRIVQVGTPLDLYNEPATLFVAEFIGKSNFLPCEIKEKNDNGIESVILGARITVPSPGKHFSFFKGEATAVIRPEFIRVSEKEDGQFTGVVRKTVFFGNFVEYEIEIKNRIIKVESYCPLEKKIYQVEDIVGIAVNLDGIRLLKNNDGEADA